MTESDREDDPTKPGGYATSADLWLALGGKPEEAEQFQTRIEYLAGNKPKLIKQDTPA